MAHMHDPHPVRLVVEDDYRRSRLTVFFRLLLAIPHFIWFFLWTLWVVLTGVVNWLISIFTGRPPAWFHGVMCGYVRYQAHLAAYLSLVGNPYPGFMGEAGEYPIDVAAAGGAGRRSVAGRSLHPARPRHPGAAPLERPGRAHRREPRLARAARRETATGRRRAAARLCVPRLVRLARARTDAEGPARRRRVLHRLHGAGDARTSCSSPTATRTPTRRRCSSRSPTGRRAIPCVSSGDPYDLRRSRVTVFFRLLLALPHILWLVLWGVAAFFARDRAVVRHALPRHAGAPRCTASSRAYVRYRLHVSAYPPARREPVPGLHRGAGRLSARSRGRRAAAAEPLEDRVPDPARDPGRSRGHGPRAARSSSPRS